jgi:hypothetical protein
MSDLTWLDELRSIQPPGTVRIPQGVYNFSVEDFRRGDMSVTRTPTSTEIEEARKQVRDALDALHAARTDAEVTTTNARLRDAVRELIRLRQATGRVI